MKQLKLGLILASLSLYNYSIVAVAATEGESVVVGQQSEHPINKPHHGESMAKVQETFGEPLERIAAVGEPPITRWEYAEFTVYFEYDKVIHAVSHRS